MPSSLSRVVGGASAVLCLAVAVASGQSVHVIKLVPSEPVGTLELTSAAPEQRPTMLPQPVAPAPDYRPDMPLALPGSAAPPPRRFDPPPPPLHAAPAPPAYRPPQALPPQALPPQALPPLPTPVYPQPAPYPQTAPTPYGPLAVPYPQPAPNPPHSAPLVPAALPPTARAVDGPIATQVWLSAESLLWWMRSQTPPPLATAATSTGSSVVLGDEGMNGGLRSGARFAAGVWFSPAQTSGVFADYFFLGRESDSSAASYSGPVNAMTAIGGGQPQTAPPTLSGRVTVNAGSSAVEGAGVLFRQRLLVGNDPNLVQVYRLDGVAGYRYLSLGESLTVREDLSIDFVNQTGPRVSVLDVFHTRNTFHGFDFGFVQEFRSGAVSLDLTTKLAVGSVAQRVSMSGGTTTTQPDGSRAFAAGALAQPAASGVHRRSETALLPEVGVSLNWQMTNNLRVSTGYNLLFLTDVVRPGDHVNSSGGPFAFDSTDIWLQGAKVGIEWRY